MKFELLPSASTAQATTNALTKFRIQMIHLAFSSEHSMNILTWTFIQFSFWIMRGSFLNVRPNITGMFHECYCAHWAMMYSCDSKVLEVEPQLLSTTSRSFLNNQYNSLSFQWGTSFVKSILSVEKGVLVYVSPIWKIDEGKFQINL